MEQVKRIEIEFPLGKVSFAIEKINKLKEVYPKAKIFIKFNDN